MSLEYQIQPKYESGITAYCWDGVPVDKMIIPLDGGLVIDLDRSTPNTTIIKEQIGPVRNTYIHHDRGTGRETSNTKWDYTPSISEIIEKWGGQ
jgi:hypothetical protein